VVRGQLATYKKVREGGRDKTSKCKDNKGKLKEGDERDSYVAKDTSLTRLVRKVVVDLKKGGP
jgi:hypothetical protein